MKRSGDEKNSKPASDSCLWCTAIEQSKGVLACSKFFYGAQLTFSTFFLKKTEDASSILNALLSVLSGLTHSFSPRRKSWKTVNAQWQAVMCFKFLVKYVMLCFVWAEWGLLFWKPVVKGLVCFEILSVYIIIILICANFCTILSNYALSPWFICYSYL